MRTEKEMLNLIINAASADERILAAYMNGSRANPAAEKDVYRDYDVVYVVSETESFLADKNWVSLFGEPAIIQEPDLNDFGWGEKLDFLRSYAWLTLFKDGSRIDLRVAVKEAALEDYLSDTLTVLLLDKYNIMPEIPAASDRGYWTKPPAKEKYRGCCNEFWWCLNNVAKGIARKQLSYTMRMYMETVHAELEKMVEWFIGINNNFSVAAGMWGKYFEKYLPPELYDMYAKTYSCGDYEGLWAAIFTACGLFRIIAPAVGEYLGFDYDKSEDENINDYLNKVKDGRFA